MSAEEREAIKDVAVAVAELAYRCVHLIGVHAAETLVGQLHDVAQRLDEMEDSP